MRNRTTLLRAEQSRAEQSRAEQSRAEHGLTAPFLRLVAARRLKLNTAFVMDNRRTLWGYCTLFEARRFFAFKVLSP